MAKFNDVLKKLYGTPSEAPAAPEPAPAPEPPKLPKPRGKGISDITVAMQAQRIFDVSKPPAPPSKGPTEAMLGQGSAPAMDQSGPWGSPE